MKMISLIRKVAKVGLYSIVVVTILILLAPGLMYSACLLSLSKFPVAPNTTAREASESWHAHGGAGLPYATRRSDVLIMDKLNPWEYWWHTVFRCKRPMTSSADLHECVYYFRGHMAAYSAANQFLRGGSGAMEMTTIEALKVTSLSIWISRNWSAEQVAVYLYEPMRK